MRRIGTLWIPPATLSLLVGCAAPREHEQRDWVDFLLWLLGHLLHWAFVEHWFIAGPLLLWFCCGLYRKQVEADERRSNDERIAKVDQEKREADTRVQAEKERLEREAKVEKERLEREAKEEEARRKTELDAASLSRRIQLAKDLSQNLRDVVAADAFLLDSNVWMAADYDAFFEILADTLVAVKRQLTISSFQFDEMCNVKRNSSFNDPKGKSARCALSRIEDFQRAGLLKIDRVALEPSKGAYADPEIIKFVTAQVKAGRRVCLVSHDVELRVRLREFLRDEHEDKFVMLDMKQVLPGADAYSWAKGQKLILADVGQTVIKPAE